MAQRQTGRHLRAGLWRRLTAQRGLARWFGDYNTVRPHQALDYATPGEWYQAPESYGAKPAAWRWK
jgi:transposase InsO family protein